MAISKDTTIYQTDIKGIYDSFNSFIGSYGGTITRLTVPGQNTTIYATQFNALNNKINEFKSDTYLKTKASWWTPATTVVAGETVIRASDFDNILSTKGHFAQVKCRNDAYNSHGTNSHSTKQNSTNNHSTRSHSTNSHTSKSHTNRSHSTNSHGTKGNGDKSNGGKWNGNNGYSGCNGYQECHSNGANGAYGTKDHGTKSHTTCKTNGKNTHGTNNHKNCTSNGTCEHGVCNHQNCTSHGVCKHKTYIDITNAYKNN